MTLVLIYPVLSKDNSQRTSSFVQGRLLNAPGSQSARLAPTVLPFHNSIPKVSVVRQVSSVVWPLAVALLPAL